MKLQSTVGILGLQGDFAKHYSHITRLCGLTLAVRYPKQLDKIDGLIIPGGERTTIGKLMSRQGLLEPLARRIQVGLPVFGTCAGAILLAKEILESQQHRLGVMDISVSRNEYGPQTESFEVDIDFPAIGRESIRSVFIRAPVIRRVGEQVRVMGEFEGRPVLVRQHNMLAATFHPELTADLRIHSYFLDMIAEAAPEEG